MKKFNSESEAVNAANKIAAANPTLTMIDYGTCKGQYDCIVVTSTVTGNEIFCGYWK